MESIGTIGIILAVIASTLVPLVLAWRVFGPLLKRSKETATILATGEPAQARVVQVALTGTSVNDQPEVRMLLDVFPPGRPPYRTEHLAVISLLAVPRIQPGCELSVRVDRGNPTRVALVGI